MSIVNFTYISTQDMIDKSQQLKGKTKLKFFKTTSNYNDELKHKNFQTQDDTFSKKAQGFSKIYLEVLLLMKFLQTNPQVKKIVFTYYDFYYTVIKTGDENDNIENEYIDFNDFTTPNHYIGIKPRETKLM